MAASALRRVVDGPVAVIDIDAHHGNGTQAIFWDDPEVLTGSVHVDPGAGWFPHFLGFESESHASNRNVCLAPGSGDGPWLAAIESLLEWAAPARGLVVALGVDAAAGDPEAPLRVTADGFAAAGRLLASLERPDGAGAGGRLRPRRDRPARGGGAGALRRKKGDGALSCILSVQERAPSLFLR